MYNSVIEKNWSHECGYWILIWIFSSRTAVRLRIWASGPVLLDMSLGAKRRTLPFQVTHVDAHSDLGIGKPGPAYVLNTVLAMEPSLRLNIDNFYRAGQLDEANYLLFALALRLISSLENVRNPNSRPDIPAFAHRDACGKYDYIQLSSFVSKLFEAKNGPEPIIPFTVFSDYSEFCADAPFDFISIAISPRYSPKEADELLPVLSRYIKQI